MSINKPKVSVVIPYYNGISWLEEAIDSVFNQTFKNFEVIVVDDGSSESTDKLEIKFKDENINWLHQENQGVSVARNNGINAAKGEYVAFLDSDDLWLPTKLEEQIELMEKENLIWSHHSYTAFDSSQERLVNTSIHRGEVYYQTFVTFKVQTSCVMIQKKYLDDNYIRFPEGLHFGEDIELYRELASKHNLGYVNKSLSLYRLRGNNAGVRAKIQLLDKARTYKKYKDVIKNKFDIFIVLSFELTIFGAKIIKFLSALKFKEVVLEFISKILYLLPYLLIKKERKLLEKDLLKVVDND